MGKLEQTVMELQEKIADLEKECAADLKRTKAKLAGIKKDQDADEKKTFADLKISFKHGKEEHVIEAAGALTQKEFTDSVRGVPRAVFGKLKETSINQKEMRGSKRQLEREFLKRDQARRTKIFHAEERLRQLKESV